MTYVTIMMLLMSSLLAGTINGQDTIDTLKIFPLPIEETKTDTFKMSEDVKDIRIEQRAINEEMDQKLEDLKKLMNEKRVMYDHTIDKKKYKWGKGKKLQTIEVEKMPKYIFENIEKYKLWLDI